MISRQISKLKSVGVKTRPTGQIKEKKSKRKVQRVPQSQTAALPRHQEEEETDKTLYVC